MNSSVSPTPRWPVVLDAVPLTVVLALVLCWTLVDRREPAPLTLVRVDTATELEAMFAAAGYTWPPAGPVPRLALQQLPADLAGLPVGSRKALFFASLTPLVLIENERLRQMRAWLERVLARPSWSMDEQRRLTALAKRYAVTGNLRDPRTQQRLLSRVDEIPLGLALAQAATESGWGTSRFAREARNLFGVWTWNAKHGLVPAGREQGKTHLVRVFPDLPASVRNYLHTLNTGAVYAPLRRLRAQLRGAGESLQPLVLANGLSRYSERGTAYVREVRRMILVNALHRLDGLALAR